MEYESFSLFFMFSLDDMMDCIGYDCKAGKKVHIKVSEYIAESKRGY